ncbi:MAG TPA: hypothetical protein VG267_12130 [Terracidiphilus sp.]|jgi:hypothetical protein|nr:hypothetical protein [Terracidiphilus sp.]
MKHALCITLLLVAAVPAFSAAARKITVAELKDMLATMHNQKKSDADAATALKQVQLSEQLDRATMNNFADELPGTLSSEQIYVLEARSAMLPPAASAIPTTAPLDAAAQQALLTKAGTYASGTWGQLPTLTATKTTLRFQDNVEALADASSMHGGSTDPNAGVFVNPYNYIHYINSTDTEIGLDHGAERVPEDKTQWGRNKMIQVMDPAPSLAAIFQEAKDSGNLKWERWELVNGKPAAVFSYQVAKKKAKMAVNVCCFPQIDQAGVVTFQSASTGSLNGGSGGGARGNLQTNTSWSPYKEKNVGYRGEFFIDPDSGIVVRMITMAEQKSSDMVHQLDTRIDYGPVTIGGKALVLPVRSVMITEVVPNGEAGAGGFSTRTTLFTSEYKNYAPAGGSASN